MGCDYVAHLYICIEMCNGNILTGYSIQSKGLYTWGFDDDKEWYIARLMYPIKIYSDGIFHKEIYKEEITIVENDRNFKWDIIDIEDYLKDYLKEFDFCIEEIKTITLYDTIEVN